MPTKTSTNKQLIIDLLLALAAASIAIGVSIAVLHYRGHAVEDWQTLLAAVFGVIGLGIAHFLTAGHQRRRDEESKIKEQKIRDAVRLEERKSIASALRVEIDHMSQTARRLVKDFDKHFPEVRTEMVEISVDMQKSFTIPAAVIYPAFLRRTAPRIKSGVTV